ncbi:hypothetical protein WN55_07428 [Dufourea novaeangliae]|uniref:Uncharacterized protein n=1 Tax=Dufourea novaeangliae TaxID=178035 RepID=A0A154PSG9_DUFNO|nr:hypothetical protein WN55_07428 [Dufourea novaeangliae]
MTGRSSAKRTGLCLLALLLFCLANDNVRVVGDPIRIPPELVYRDAFINNPEDLILLDKLKRVNEEKKNIEEREKELVDMQVMIQSVLEARAKDKARAQPSDYSAEELPTPNAVVSQAQRSGKRTALSCE